MIHYQQCAVTIKLFIYEAVTEVIYWAVALNPQNCRVPSIFKPGFKRSDATSLAECGKHWLLPGYFQCFTCDFAVVCLLGFFSPSNIK